MEDFWAFEPVHDGGKNQQPTNGHREGERKRTNEHVVGGPPMKNGRNSDNKHWSSGKWRQQQLSNTEVFDSFRSLVRSMNKDLPPWYNYRQSKTYTDSSMPLARPSPRDQRLSPQNSSCMFRLHEEILDFVSFMTPTPHELTIASESLEAIIDCIRDYFPEAGVSVFGSRTTMLLLPTSDWDISLSNVPATSQNMRGLAAAFHAKQLISSIEVIDKARVPIIKLVAKESKMQVDISFLTATEDAVDSRAMIKDLIARYPPVRPLIIVLKAYLKQRSLNDTYTGGVGSYLLVLMATHIVQMALSVLCVAKSLPTSFFTEEYLQKHVYSDNEGTDSGSSKHPQQVSVEYLLRKDEMYRDLVQSRLESIASAEEKVGTFSRGSTGPHWFQNAGGHKADPSLEESASPIDLKAKTVRGRKITDSSAVSPPGDDNIANVLNLGTLLMLFFEEYGYNLNVQTTGIGVRGLFGGYFSRRERSFTAVFDPGHLCVENPLNPTLDSGAQCWRFWAIRNAFSNSHTILSHAMRMWNGKSSEVPTPEKYFRGHPVFPVGAAALRLHGENAARESIMDKLQWRKQRFQSGTSDVSDSPNPLSMLSLIIDPSESFKRRELDVMRQACIEVDSTLAEVVDLEADEAESQTDGRVVHPADASSQPNNVLDDESSSKDPLVFDKADDAMQALNKHESAIGATLRKKRLLLDVLTRKARGIPAVVEAPDSWY